MILWFESTDHVVLVVTVASCFIYATFMGSATSAFVFKGSPIRIIMQWIRGQQREEQEGEQPEQKKEEDNEREEEKAKGEGMKANEDGEKTREPREVMEEEVKGEKDESFDVHYMV